MDVDESGGATAKDDDEDDDYSEAMNDPAYLQSVLESLPGVDPQSEEVRSAMGSLTGQQRKEQEDKKKEEEKKRKDGGAGGSKEKK